MKKQFYTLLFLILCQFAFAQSNDYRSAEDGINKLLTSEEFLKDLNGLETDLSLEKIDNYFTKYVPEYAGFKIKNKIDFNAIYYANTDGVTSDLVASKMSKMLGLDYGQSQMLNSALSGNLTYNSTNPYSTGLSGQMYERGKDKRADFAVDYASDFFQNKFGDGGLNSALIDVGAGLFGKLIFNINKKYYEKMAQQAFEDKLHSDDSVLLMGSLGLYKSQFLKKDRKKDGFEFNEDQADLYSHYLARKNMPIMQNAMMASSINYDKAIENLNTAIKYYLQNPNRAYYLYLAYTDRAFCKMNIGAYRAAIIDYYQGQKILEIILKGELKDYSIRFDLDAKKNFVGLLKNSDIISVLTGRAYAKYRNKDYNGAISDAAEGIKIANALSYKGPNDFKDVLGAIIAMSQYGQGKIKESFSTFSNISLNDDLIADDNDDMLINFKEFNKDYIAKYYTLPSYFPFDIVQIKGLVMYSEGKIDEAIKAYTNIYNTEYDLFKYTKEPKRLFSRNNGDISAVISSLSSFYFMKGDKNKAFEMINKAIDLNREIPEYYFKRAGYYKSVNKIKEADEDLKIAKNPKEYNNNVAAKSEAKTSSGGIAKTNAKSMEYFATEYAKYHDTKNYQKEFEIIKEALSSHSNNSGFLNYAKTLIYTTKNKEYLTQFLQFISPDSADFYLLKAFEASINNDVTKEEEFLNKALDKGYSLYFLNKSDAPLQAHRKSYFCRTLSKYISKTNNSFIANDFNKEKMAKTLDSTYFDLKQKNPNLDLDSKIMKESRDKINSKLLGEYEKLLKILDSNKMVLEMSAVDSYDKIECMLILGKKEEALSFAKKIFAKNKFMFKPKGEATTLSEFINNNYFYAIQNLAQNGCD